MELIRTYTDAASAFSADNTNQELCDASMTAYLAVIDAECTGYTDLSQAEINFISTMCDIFLETEAVYGCTGPDNINYDRWLPNLPRILLQIHPAVRSSRSETTLWSRRNSSTAITKLKRF